MNRSTPFSLKKPQVLKGGPRHPVLIAVQPTEPAEQHTAPQPLPLRGQQQQRARAAETARAMPPSFPPGVVNSSSSSSSQELVLSTLLPLSLQMNSAPNCARVSLGGGTDYCAGSDNSH